MKSSGKSKYYKNINWQEKLLLIIAFKLFVIICIYFLKTTAIPIRISEDFEVWKNDIEIVAIMFGPFIAAVGAYFVWKSLEVQGETKVVEGYLQIVKRLENDFPNLVRELNQLKNNNPNSPAWEYLILGVSNHLYININEFMGITLVLNKLVKNPNNRQLCESSFASYTNQMIVILSTFHIIDPESDFKICNNLKILPHTIKVIAWWKKIFVDINIKNKQV